MRPTPSVRLITENLPEQRFLEAIFRPEIELGSVEVESALTASGATGIAEYSLMEHPERPVALVINTDTEDPEEIEEEVGGPVQRILAQITPTGWHAALAIPKVDAWVMADPRIKRAFEAEEATRANRYEQAARIGGFAQRAPIDRAAIRAAFPEFTALAKFIETHAPVPKPAVAAGGRR